MKQNHQEPQPWNAKDYSSAWDSLQRLAARIICNKKQKFRAKLFNTRFRAHFGCSLATATEILLIIRRNKLPLRLNNHLLWALHFLKAYPTERTAAPRFGTSETTWRVTTKQVVREVLACLNLVIIFLFFPFIMLLITERIFKP